MAFQLPEAYTRGAGKIFIGDRDLSTGGLNSSGLEFLGDASELSLDPSQNFVEHMEHQTGDGRMDLRIPSTTTLSGNLVLDNSAAANLKRFLRGKQTPTAGSSITGESHAFPGAGKAIVLDHPATGAVTVSGLAERTDNKPAFIVDGRVVYFPEGTAASTQGGSVTVAYNSPAYQDVDLFGEAFKEYYLFFDGLNTTVQKHFSLELYKVSFDPATLGSLISDEIIQLSVGFQALYEPLKSSSNLGGYGRFVMED